MFKTINEDKLTIQRERERKKNKKKEDMIIVCIGRIDICQQVYSHTELEP